MSRVVAVRNKLKPEFQKSYGVNPTYLVFIARARRRDAEGLPVGSTASCAATRS